MPPNASPEPAPTHPHGHSNGLPWPNPAVIWREVAEGAVLLHTESEVYFGLNDVGVRVWELLPPVSRSAAELYEKLASLYPDVPAETLRDDVEELLGHLRAQALVIDAP